MFTEHIERVRSATSGRYTLANIPDWIVRNTRLAGEPFSYVNHEFQLQILLDTSREKIVRKCSQVGLTELSFREVLAILRILPNTTAIYTLPSADFMEKMVKTRVDPIILDSKDLRFAVSKDVNSAQIKQFGTSFLYLNGTFGQNQAISVPADILVHDEVDFSNMTVLTTYESRLKHSPHKLRREFSTPTLPKRGISARFDNSRRHFNFCKCNHCNEWFLPSYWNHVRIPEWDKPLDEITSSNLHTTEWRDAKLHCPRCHKVPSLQHQHRQWVIENPGDRYEAAGYAVSPFDAPNVISTPYLVERSTKYERLADFWNFELGLPYEDAKESLTESLLKALHVEGDAGRFGAMFFGADMGLTCHLMVGTMDAIGNLIVVHRERCPLSKFEERKTALCKQYSVLVSVMDAFPYVDLVLRLQAVDLNLFGAVSHDSDKLRVFEIQAGEEEEDKGKLPIKQAKINRNMALDELSGLLLARKAVFLKDNEEEQRLFIAHCLDIKRTQQLDKKGQLKNVWVKSEKGDDHYFFALLYLYTATRLRGMVQASFPGVDLMTTFRLKNH